MSELEQAPQAEKGIPHQAPLLMSLTRVQKQAQYLYREGLYLSNEIRPQIDRVTHARIRFSAR